MLFKRACIWLTLFLLYSATAIAQDINYRLSDKIKPSFQQINLTIDPDKDEFSGDTTIDITVTETTDHIEFYQLELDIEKVTLIDGDKSIPLTVSSHAYDIQRANAPTSIKAKQYQLHIKFKGKVNTTSDGMYLSKFEDNNYIFTQFEDMHARRAFPSFDEPSFKIPFQLTIKAPEKHTVLSNTLVKTRSVKDGWQTVAFNRTPAMPTYIVAYAVGEFDFADIPNLKMPAKIYTPKGQASRTKFAAKNTAGILAKLESYFGSAYPFEKLDFIAVPNFTHGAMENAGLVTYRSSLLLLDDEPRLNEQSSTLNVIAHELAHMWYGNLVTMAWWDDLWLNEAFASWMASKVMMDLYPEQNYQARLVQESAFSADASPTVKPVKKVVRNSSDVMDGLGLNYSKGESVLKLIESLVGEKAFQQAIQNYMKNNAWGNAQADDLWQVLSSVADFDVPGMMKTYLEQPAYPLVEFAQSGEIKQRRYHLLGAEVTAQTWTIPLAISYKKNGQIKRTQLFLKDATTSVAELAEADWIYPNDNAMGYLRWKIPAAQLTALLEDITALNVRERKNLLYNTDALFAAGEIELIEYMQVLDVLSADQDPIVGSSVVASLTELNYLVDKSNEAIFGQFANSKLLSWFTRLGLQEQESDSADISRLRNAVYGVLGRYSNDPKVKEASLVLAKQYLADPTSVPKGIAVVALRNAVRNGDKLWFETLKKTYINNTDANVQGTLGAAMMFPQSENVHNTLDFAMSDAVGPAHVISFIARAANMQDNDDDLYVWLKLNFEALIAKIPAYHATRLPEYASNSCSVHDIALSRDFYAQRKDKVEGMARSFDISLQKSEQCLALKQANQKAFNAYLSQALK
ncbi:M1 family metallopeptidase [Paraglaciecola hydrolytica]|uniref:Aminopeptidase n=1 Tax=Paraglaciecola hydrolytica TaxID=1799789 RepID=A0A136A0F7_9ALTE|nr:M1 family metallopeptidase [Paraglaciecola hydrolytica]KXI28739.1 peptidase M1 [Paraglaciecola hydrolytica]